MSKVICDICGTSYPETSAQCPICGYARDAGDLLGDELDVWDVPAPAPATSVQGSTDAGEDLEEAPAPRKAPKAGKSSSSRSGVKGGKFSQANVRKRNNSTPAYQVQPAVEQPDEEEAEDTPRESNALLVVLLVVVIVALLAVTGYITVKYFIPNVLNENEEQPVMTEFTEAPSQPTESLEKPCTGLALINGGTVTLEQEGQHWLLNVVVLPGGCTDSLTYTSSDESVATVSADGRVTAVGEGTCTITMACGEQSLDCTVVCDFPEATTEAEPTEEE